MCQPGNRLYIYSTHLVESVPISYLDFLMTQQELGQDCIQRLERILNFSTELLEERQDIKLTNKYRRPFPPSCKISSPPIEYQVLFHLCETVGSFIDWIWSRDYSVSWKVGRVIVGYELQQYRKKKLATQVGLCAQRRRDCSVPHTLNEMPEPVVSVMFPFSSPLLTPPFTF